MEISTTLFQQAELIYNPVNEHNTCGIIVQRVQMGDRSIAGDETTLMYSTIKRTTPIYNKQIRSSSFENTNPQPTADTNSPFGSSIHAFSLRAAICSSQYQQWRS